MRSLKPRAKPNTEKLVNKIPVMELSTSSIALLADAIANRLARILGQLDFNPKISTPGDETKFKLKDTPSYVDRDRSHVQPNLQSSDKDVIVLEDDIRAKLIKLRERKNG